MLMQQHIWAYGIPSGKNRFIFLAGFFRRAGQNVVWPGTALWAVGNASGPFVFLFYFIFSSRDFKNAVTL